MGLDQYGQTFRKSTGEIIDTDFAYWRKNRQLNGWMQDLYIKKHSNDKDFDESFNCKKLELDADDIHALIADIEDGCLAERDDHGFFWGSFGYDKDQAEIDLDFCKRALEALKDEDVGIYYSCWY